MDLALTIVDVLRQIYELRDAIRRQRHVNRRTYLRMMEIYVELQSSEGVQTNATLARTATLDKFSAAVTKFLLYLQKFHDMHRVVRLFKFTTMEEQRLKIVDEIDQLYRMLNLATAVAVMDGAAAASSNAARLFAKLEDMHGDIRLTHDQIHAALLADKQQVVVPRKRILTDQEPTASRRVLVRQGPILTTYAHEVGDDPAVDGDEMEEKSLVQAEKVAVKKRDVKRSAVCDDEEEKLPPVDTKAQVEVSTADVVVGTTVLAVQKVELEELKQTAAYDDEEEKEPSNRQLTLVHKVAEEAEIDDKSYSQEPGLIESTADKVVKDEEEEQPAVMKEAIEAKEAEADQPSGELSSEVAEDKEAEKVVEHKDVADDEPNKQQPAPTQVTADEAVKEEGTLSVELSDEPVEEEKASELSGDYGSLLRDTTDEVVEDGIQATADEVAEAEDAPKLAPIQGGVDTEVDEPNCEGPFDEVVGDKCENETSSLHSAPSSDTTSEKDAKTEDQPLQQSHSSVPLLIKLLGADDTTAQQKEDLVLDLLRKCVTNSNRVQVYKTKGIPVLTNLVRHGETFLTQLYALHCLSWFTFSFSKLRESDFMELINCVREPTHEEMLSLLHDLQSNDDEVKERAALQCSCVATRVAGDTLRQVGVLPLLIGVLKNGTDNQKLWAAEAFVTLASDDDENCVAITRGGAIPPLVLLLRSGTDMQKQEAAYALGNLAANNEANRAKIAREGAIPPMVEFVKSVTDAQNQWAVYALGFLSLNNEENRVLIAQEGAIRPLVNVLRVGTRAQKQWAAYTLGNLAHNDANRAEITREGAITPLIQLLRTGTAMQKQRAAFALGNLACDNDTVTTDFDEAILPLVDLVRMGSDTQKEDAAYTLGNLAANNDARRAEIGRKGAIAPLVKLLKTGDGEQKQWAAFALRCLAYDNALNRVAIAEEGAIEPLTAMMEEGTEEQKEEAAHALEHLVVKDVEAANTFIPDRVMTSLRGYWNADTISQNANVAAALNTLGTVREGVLPLFRKLVKSDADTENTSQPATREDSKAETKGNSMAGAW